MIGVDFGTTNSVVSRLGADGRVTTVRHAFGTGALDVVRSVLCLAASEDPRRALDCSVGPDAIERHLEDPQDTRLMMSLKSYLAQGSFTETRVFGRPFTIEGLVTLFLRAILPGDARGAALVAGRPVRFVGERADDALGERRLRAAFGLAGWERVTTVLEPEAAGYRFARDLTEPATVLVGDFGGGTSDFSVMRFEPGARGVALGHAGVGVAGDAFDGRIVEHVVAPLFGKGSSYSPAGQALPVPAEWFTSLGRWHRLSLMAAPRTLRDIEAVMRSAEHPDRLGRLLELLRSGLGYELARAVSRVKAELSSAPEAVLRFAHGGIRIEAAIRRADFEAWIGADLARLDGAVEAALRDAGVGERDVDRVFLTGGTSLVPAVRRLFEARFGAGKVAGGGEFVSVAEGLVLIGAGV
jgi:hypothetical chaperone protein